MLKFKEGKLMYVNLLILILLLSSGSVISMYYGVKPIYTIFMILIVVMISIISVLQVMLAMRLYKIAKEEVIVDSKNNITEDQK